MKHRNYKGKLLYLTDGQGEMGRESFNITIQPDGTRTMRANCEMYGITRKSHEKTLEILSQRRLVAKNSE